MDSIYSFISTYWLQVLLSAIIGYLLGSISFSIIFTKVFEKKDIRDQGSGNAGFTNTLRCASKKAAFLTLSCDFLKGVVAVIIGGLIFQYLGAAQPSFVMLHIGKYIAGFACFLGHIKPVFFNFRGGKGVLTCAAIICMIDWRVFLISISIFIIVLLISKIVSLSSICAATSLPIAGFVISYFVDYLPNTLAISSQYTVTYVFITTLMTLLFAVMMIYMHRTNIVRLKNGTEKRIKLKSK